MASQPPAIPDTFMSGVDQHGTVRCHHGTPAARRVCGSNTHHPGRVFWVCLCRKDDAEHCSFWKWDDDLPPHHGAAPPPSPASSQPRSQPQTQLLSQPPSTPSSQPRYQPATPTAAPPTAHRTPNFNSLKRAGSPSPASPSKRTLPSTAPPPSMSSHAPPRAPPQPHATPHTPSRAEARARALARTPEQRLLAKERLLAAIEEGLTQANDAVASPARTPPPAAAPTYAHAPAPASTSAPAPRSAAPHPSHVQPTHSTPSHPTTTGPPPPTPIHPRAARTRTPHDPRATSLAARAARRASIADALHALPRAPSPPAAGPGPASASAAGARGAPLSMREYDARRREEAYLPRPDESIPEDDAASEGDEDEDEDDDDDVDEDEDGDDDEPYADAQGDVRAGDTDTELETESETESETEPESPTRAVQSFENAVQTDETTEYTASVSDDLHPADADANIDAEAKEAQVRAALAASQAVRAGGAPLSRDTSLRSEIDFDLGGREERERARAVRRERERRERERVEREREEEERFFSGEGARAAGARPGSAGSAMEADELVFDLGTDEGEDGDVGMDGRGVHAKSANGKREGKGKGKDKGKARARDDDAGPSQPQVSGFIADAAAAAQLTPADLARMVDSLHALPDYVRELEIRGEEQAARIVQLEAVVKRLEKEKSLIEKALPRNYKLFGG